MKKFTLSIVFSVAVFCGCSLGIEESDKNDSSIRIVSWNVQNVFDGTDDGTEYEEYRTSSYWSDSLYKLRLSDIERVLTYDSIKSADVIVLNEVENEKVVRDILSMKVLEKRGFRYFVCAGEENGAIKTAVLSCIPIKSVKIHSVEKARPVIEVEYDSFYLLALHAKSKAGNDEESSFLRYNTGLTVNEISSRIQFEKPGKPIAVAGDFNEDWNDTNTMVNISTLSGKITDCPIIVSGKRSDSWYCFWLDDTLQKSRNGSYYYSGKWSCIDNILLSDAEGLVCAGVVSDGILSKTDGTPNTWIRNMASGVSDHFPVWIEFTI